MNFSALSMTDSSSTERLALQPDLPLDVQALEYSRLAELDSEIDNCAVLHCGISGLSLVPYMS